MEPHCEAVESVSPRDSEPKYETLGIYHMQNAE